MKLRVARITTWVLPIAVAVLTGCYRGPGAEEPLFPPDLSRFPVGVMTPAPSGAGEVTGVFPSARPGDPHCCWLGRTASFDVLRSPDADQLFLTVFVPRDLYPGLPQGIRVGVNGAALRHYPLGAGVAIVAVPLRAKRGSTVAAVTIVADQTFVPKRRRLNGDTRELSIYLKAVRTGRR